MHNFAKYNKKRLSKIIQQNMASSPEETSTYFWNKESETRAHKRFCASVDL